MSEANPMTYDEARRWLVNASVIALGAYGVVLLIAPATPFPLEFSKALQLLQIIFPLFLGYLSSAVVYVFRGVDVTASLKLSPLLEVLVKAPFILVMLLLAVTFAVYGASNWPGSPHGDGMKEELLSNLVSLFLGVHAATTSTIILYLFRNEDDARGG